ncbi:MAG: hypothetical protein LUD17_13720 [Bacteroidales bacterium]|nr:hypothetical protein [Bacteroidales bacterium]
MKTEIYNLIILDESGSMRCVWDQTISGCNETIDTIKASQTKYAGEQEHYVSIFAFNANGFQPSRYLLKNVPASEAKDISRNDFQPNGCTPLYDAVGSTLVDLKAKVNSSELAIGSVTIITDGMENSSKHYTREQVALMIDQLKEMGWNFSFIGANIDVKATAASLNIDNHLEFQQTEEGTRQMFARERESRMAYTERLCCAMAEPSEDYESASKETILKRFKKASKGYFG